MVDVPLSIVRLQFGEYYTKSVRCMPTIASLETPVRQGDGYGYASKLPH